LLQLIANVIALLGCWLIIAVVVPVIARLLAGWLASTSRMLALSFA